MIFGSLTLSSALDSDDLFRAETNCPVFKCSGKDEVAVQKNGGAKKSGWPFVYGCDSSAFDMFSVMSPDMLSGGGFPGKGSGNPNKAKLQKCCKERDFSNMICGRSKKQIEDTYSNCSKKKCKGDKNCNMQSNFGVMMGTGLGVGDKDKCSEYRDAQASSCECVKKGQKDEHFRKSLQQFYSVFAKDKLPTDKSEIDDAFLEETVYKKFKKGQEPEIWHALFSKYVKDLVNKVRPKPDYGAGGMDDLGLGKDYDDLDLGVSSGSKKKKGSANSSGGSKKKPDFEPRKPPKMEKESKPVADEPEASSVFGSGSEEEEVEL